MQRRLPDERDLEQSGKMGLADAHACAFVWRCGCRICALVGFGAALGGVEETPKRPALGVARRRRLVDLILWFSVVGGALESQHGVLGIEP